MRLVILTAIGLALLSIVAVFVINNLTIVNVKFWSDYSISAPLGVVTLASLGFGFFIGFIWYTWILMLRYLQLKTKEYQISQLVDLYKNTVILNQVITLGEEELAREISEKLKSPVPELDFSVEIEKVKTIIDPNQKLKVLESLRGKFPTNPYLICELAQTLIQLGQENLAMDHLKSINQTVPTLLSLKFGAELALKLGRLEEAKEWVFELKRLGVKDHKLFQALMEAQVEHLYLEGKDWYAENKQLVKEYPLSLVGMEYMARYYKDSNPNLALKYYRQRAEVGESAVYWRDLWEFLVQLGRVEEAIKVAEESLTKQLSSEDKAVVKLDLVRLLLNLNRWNDATKVLDSFTDDELNSIAKISVDRLRKFYLALLNLKKGSTIESLRVLNTVLVG